ncbi:CACTA transposable element [Tanacetum coccineum]
MKKKRTSPVTTISPVTTTSTVTTISPITHTPLSSFSRHRHSPATDPPNPSTPRRHFLSLSLIYSTLSYAFMTIDKSWTTLRNRTSSQFNDGLDAFLERRTSLNRLVWYAVRVDGKTKTLRGKKVPKKVLRYFTLTPRLRRMYNSRHIAKYMTWHATGKCKEDGKMCHPVDGKTWKDFDQNHKQFALEPRNVRLGLAADGFNPFGNLSQGYSMWPVILTTYNLPSWLCMKESNLMLSMLIPGPKSPGKDIDVFLRPLIEELKTLWSEGLRMRDAATETYFTMKAMLLWTINDYPARSYLSGWSGQGYLACPTCNKDTPSTRVLGKIAYDGHRRFLPKKHRWRKDKSFNGMDDTSDPPETLSNANILDQLARLPQKNIGETSGFWVDRCKEKT